MKNPKVYGSFAILKKIMNKAHLNPLYFIVTLFFSFLAAVFDGLSKAFLIPLINGILYLDFSFVKENSILGDIARIDLNFLCGSNLSAFILLVGIIFILAAMHHIMAYFATVTMAYQIRKFCDELRRLIFRRYLSFGKLFFDKSNFGYLNAVLIDFTDLFAHCLTRIQMCFTEVFRAIIYLLILFIVSWKLTIFVLVIFPVLHYALSGIIQKIKRTSGGLSFSKEELAKKAFNILSNMTLVKSYTKEKMEEENFSRLSYTRKILEFSMDKKQNLIRPVQDLFVITGFLFLIAAIVLITKGREGSISVFLVYLYILRGGMDSFGSLNELRAMAAVLTGPARAISEVFDDRNRHFVIGGTKNFGSLKNVIEFRKLDFSYIKEKQILNKITFSVKKGEVTAIVGPSGVGKTTLVSLLMRFYDCPPQSIIIDGTDIRDFTLESIRRHIALVSQDTLLFNDTLRNNIIYGLDEVDEKELLEALKKARLYDFVAQLPQGLETLIGDKGVKLSGGERQRVSIARALLKGSEILILDEATSSLDSLTEKRIQEAIEEAIKGRTTIVIAHRLSTIKNADKIVVIENGRIIEQGSLNELLNKKGKFYQYWEEQKFY